MKAQERECTHSVAKKFMACLLAAAMVLSAAACGKGGAETGGNETTAAATGEEETKEAYVAKEVDLKMSESAFRTMKQVGDDLYYTAGSYDDEAGTGNYHIYRYAILDESTEELPVRFGSCPMVFDIGADGSICAAVSHYIEGEGAKQKLEKYDASGSQVYSREINEWLDTGKSGNMEYPVNVLSDGEGRVYLAFQTFLLLVDGQGELSGRVELMEIDTDDLSNGLRAMCRGKDGNVYVVVSEFYGIKSSLKEIDFDKKKLNVISEEFPIGGRGVLGVGLEKDLMTSDGSVVYEYDLAQKELIPVLSWADCGILGNQVDFAGMVSSGNILAVTSDYAAGTRDVQLLTRLSPDEMKERVELVLGSVSPVTELEQAVAQFNKGSFKYHITLKRYMEGDWSEEAQEDACTRLKLDLASGHGPDIIDLMSGIYNDTESLVNQGFLEDLTPYLEQSAVMSREDFMDSVLEACTYDGVLAGLPKQFIMNTLVVRASDVGKESAGWTLEEFMAFCEKYPETQVFKRTGKSEILRVALAYGIDAFVDQEAGKCSFDSEEFIKLLEFADRHGDVVSPKERQTAFEKAQHREILILETSVMEPEELQIYEEAFEGEPCVIGYPTADGSAASTISINAYCGICATSEHKEAAWAFLESHAMNEGQEYIYALPAVKRRLREEIEKSKQSGHIVYQTDSEGNYIRDENNMLIPEYMTDENGNPVLDENGEPVPKLVTKTVTYGDRDTGWSITYHPLTEDEEAQLTEIIRTGRLSRGGRIYGIINEEAEDFFHGSKSAKDVADVIQRRVQLYLSENQ